MCSQHDNCAEYVFAICRLRVRRMLSSGSWKLTRTF